MIREAFAASNTNALTSDKKSINTLLQIIQEGDASFPAEDRCLKEASNPWFSCSYPSKQLPDQGWKLHISALVTSAETVLKRVLPILLEAHIPFKITASLTLLEKLNAGHLGRSQIGKFMTIYPMDDDEATQLAIMLDEATKDLKNQHVPIPSDRPLYQGSLIYYRYGAIHGKFYLQNELGLIQPAIKTPDNDLAPDMRETHYAAPAWANDPFIAAGIARELAPPTRIIKDRYLVIATIAEGNRRVYFGVDLETTRSCVIKGQGLPVFRGRDQFGLLRHEAQILRRLQNHPNVPMLLDEVEQDNSLFLVIEDIAGETLQDRIYRQEETEHILSQQQLIAWGIEIAKILSSIHADNLVYSDLKPANIIIGPQGKIYLIDFDSTHEQGDPDTTLRGRGTPGFMSPQQRSLQPTTVADDIYGIGSLLYVMLTAVDMTQIPNERIKHIILARPLELLRPDINPALSAIIQRCLREQPEDRYPSMSALIEALVAIPNNEEPSSIELGHEVIGDAYPLVQKHYKTLAGQLLKTLCAVAEKNDNGMYWRSSHPMSYELPLRDISKGNSGTLLALAELVSELGTGEGSQVLAEGARWLRTSQPFNQRPLPGLYVGEAGVGAALLRAGQVLHEKELIEAALDQGRKVAALPLKLIDLYNGAAGRLRFHLLLWNETQEREQLQAALACADYLLSLSQKDGEHETYWATPDGHGKFSDQVYLGYAHGAAGIADALLDLFAITGDERLLSTIRGAARWLARQAVPSLVDSSGLNWPATVGNATKPAYWCHGAAGIGRFFLHAANCDIFPDARTFAERAARSTARSIRWAGPTQCHGLAGNIDFLIDMYQFSGDVAYRTEALSLGKILETFGTEKDGHLIFMSETATIFTPDYSVGYAGVATSFLRLSDAERLPSLLSCAGFLQRS